MVYASFIPPESLRDGGWRLRPWQICDGGPEYFGVEVDVESASAQHIDFDSCLCAIVPVSNPTERAREP